jgi:hypothetical protein
MVQAMIVFSNHRLGAASELLVSPLVAETMLRETAVAASSTANGWWERELVRWLRDRAGTSASAEAGWPADSIDVGEVAWSPENFETQRQFLLAAIHEAARTSEHARALGRWAAMIEAHPRDSVQVGRRWIWLATA